MIKLNRNKLGDFEIYEKQEADNLGIKYKYWKETYPNEYGISDDGYVSKCIKESFLSGKVVKVFPYAQVRPIASQRLRFVERYQNRAWGLSEKPALEREARRGRTKRFVQAYIKMFFLGKVDWYALGIIYNPNEKIPQASAKRLFKNKWVQQMIDEGLKKELQNKGIDKSFYLDRILEAIDIARSKKDATNMLKAAEMIGSILEEKTELNEIQDVSFRVLPDIQKIISGGTITTEENGQEGISRETT